MEKNRYEKIQGYLRRSALELSRLEQERKWAFCGESLCNNEDRRYKKMPIDILADKDCTLFLWITFPLLNEMNDLLNAWGFTYKTVAFVWVKQNKKSDSLF